MDFSFWERLWDTLKYHPDAPMIFNSGFFLFFFLFTIFFYQFFYNLKRAKFLFLTVLSIYFYYKSSGLYFYLIIVSSLIDYFAGLWMEKLEQPWTRKSLMTLSVISNFGILGYFKYTNFFFDTLNSLHLSSFQPVDIFLPVGISFFTFQSLSYTIDIYRRQLKAEKNFLDFLFFVSFFPQLVAGPIVRAADFLPQLRQPTVVTKEDIGKAVFLIATGLFKKAVIADYISINFVDRIFEWPTRYTGVENLMGLYGYALQIYCDFSGYSDMAIGLALLLGFKLRINFDSPYQSASITEFWRRWHISLSSWLKDYLYITLGGNRKGKVRQYINLMLTMLLGGLWHGAAWKFVVWGGIHGFILSVEKFLNFPEWVKGSKLKHVIGVIVTFHIVCLAWIFFRATSYQSAIDMINQILFYFNGSVFFQFIEAYPVIVLLMVIGFLLHFAPKSWEIKTEQFVQQLPLVGKALVLVVVIWLVIQVKSSDIQPFIYFQF
jgi:D-alanyl-lipoteichoic acid acyltransferase DltB (MBOAT superfamily)